MRIEISMSLCGFWIAVQLFKVQVNMLLLSKEVTSWEKSLKVRQYSNNLYMITLMNGYRTWQKTMTGISLKIQYLNGPQ